MIRFIGDYKVQKFHLEQMQATLIFPLWDRKMKS